MTSSTTAKHVAIGKWADVKRALKACREIGAKISNNGSFSHQAKLNGELIFRAIRLRGSIWACSYYGECWEPVK